MKYPTVKSLAGCTDVTPCLELHHLHLPYVNCPDFSKHSLFAYPHHSVHEDMPLEQYISYFFIEYVRIFTNRTHQNWWWISSDSRGADLFRSFLFAVLLFTHTKSWYVYLYVQVDTLFMIWPITCWKYCIFNIDHMDAKIDHFERNRTILHMRTNEACISKSKCALFIV